MDLWVSAVSTKITANLRIDNSQEKISKKRQIELENSGSSSDSESDSSNKYYLIRKLLKSEHRLAFDKSMTPTKTRSPIKTITEEMITEDLIVFMMIFDF